jgi:hypothetical protein
MDRLLGLLLLLSVAWVVLAVVLWKLRLVDCVAVVAICFAAGYTIAAVYLKTV